MPIPTNPIVQRRLARNWTQVQLASAAQLSLGTISTVENGSAPELETARKLALAFGVTEEEWPAFLTSLCPSPHVVARTELGVQLTPRVYP